MYFNILECDYTVGSAAAAATSDKTYNAFSASTITTDVLHAIGTDADACWNKASGGVLKISGLGADISASFASTTATSITFDLPPV